MNLFELERYRIRRQVFKFFGASFHVYDGEKVAGFCAQKAFVLKEDIRIYTDETKQHELLTIRARQIVDFSAAYDVVDPATGSKVGALRRRGFASLLRDSWELLDANDRPLASLREDSAWRALLRRTLLNLIPQRFRLEPLGGGGGGAGAELRQRFNPFVFSLEVTVPRDCAVDRRLVFAAAVLIAAIEGRQKD